MSTGLSNFCQNHELKQLKNIGDEKFKDLKLYKKFKVKKKTVTYHIYNRYDYL